MRCFCLQAIIKWLYKTAKIQNFLCSFFGIWWRYLTLQHATAIGVTPLSSGLFVVVNFACKYLNSKNFYFRMKISTPIFQETTSITSETQVFVTSPMTLTSTFQGYLVCEQTLEFTLHTQHVVRARNYYQAISAVTWKL